MATTGFWPIRKDLAGTIKYIENPDKTTKMGELDKSLYAAVKYVGNLEKTDRCMYVKGINCSKHSAYSQMMAVKHKFGERGKNIAYHGYQSFATGEVTPEQAFAIGVQTARKMWGDKYQVVVTTHLNTDNLHNHFVVNSVSFKDGSKFRDKIGDHMELRRISDEICREQGLSVLENSEFYSKVKKKEYWVHKNGGLTHRDILRKDVDEAIANSRSVLDFEYCMKNIGYRFERDFRYEHPFVIADGWKRAVRLDSLGEAYSRDGIRKRCSENTVLLNTIYKAPYKRKPLLIIEYELRRLERMDTVQLLFEIFIDLLKICTGNNIEQQQSRPLSPAMRREVQKLDKYLEEYKLLCDNEIESPKELFNFQNNISEQIAALEQKRQGIRNKIRRAKTPEEDFALKEKAKEITKQITPLRKQKDIAMRIEEHIPKIHELLEQERNIEMKRNNLIKKKERGYER